MSDNTQTCTKNIIHVRRLVNKTNTSFKYSRSPETETADLSQFHASLNLSQFRAYCLFHRNLSTAIKNK